MELGKVRATVREQPGRSSEQPFGHPEILRRLPGASSAMYGPRRGTWRRVRASWERHGVHGVDAGFRPGSHGVHGVWMRTDTGYGDWSAGTTRGCGTCTTESADNDERLAHGVGAGSRSVVW